MDKDLICYWYIISVEHGTAYVYKFYTPYQDINGVLYCDSELI